jgi:hypothetical protein
MSSVVRQLLTTTTIRAGVDLGRRARDRADRQECRGPTTIGHTFAQTVRRPVVPRRLLRRATCAYRKRFGAALALLEAGESEALIFTKVDRASRYTSTHSSPGAVSRTSLSGPP